MVNTTEVKFNLSKSQMQKLALARQKGTSVKLRLHNGLILPNARIPLELTASEIKKLSDGRPHDITISATRVKNGGFLPALLGALPILASVIGGVSGLTGIAKNIKDMVKGPAGKGGSGLFLNPQGNGLFLNQ